MWKKLTYSTLLCNEFSPSNIFSQSLFFFFLLFPIKSEPGIVWFCISLTLLWKFEEQCLVSIFQQEQLLVGSELAAAWRVRGQSWQFLMFVESSIHVVSFSQELRAIRPFNSFPCSSVITYLTSTVWPVEQLHLLIYIRRQVSVKAPSSKQESCWSSVGHHVLLVLDMGEDCLWAWPLGGGHAYLLHTRNAELWCSLRETSWINNYLKYSLMAMMYLTQGTFKRLYTDSVLPSSPSLFLLLPPFWFRLLFFLSKKIIIKRPTF